MTRTAKNISRPALRLVNRAPSHDTIEALELLLEAAKAGEITGLAYVATLPGMRFVSSATGHCCDNPSFARGAAMFLGDQLAGLAHDAHELNPSGIK